jgi:hypothetical protein
VSSEKISKDETLKELKAIKNLLIIQLLKSGVTSEEIDVATGMGAGNIRKKFAGVTKKGKSQNAT